MRYRWVGGRWWLTGWVGEWYQQQLALRIVDPSRLSEFDTLVGLTLPNLLLLLLHGGGGGGWSCSSAVPCVGGGGRGQGTHPTPRGQGSRGSGAEAIQIFESCRVRPWHPTPRGQVGRGAEGIQIFKSCRWYPGILHFEDKVGRSETGGDRRDHNSNIQLKKLHHSNDERPA